MIKLDYKVVIAGGAVLLVVAWVLRGQVKAAAVAVGESVNPVSPENIFYKAASGVVNAVSGDGDKNASLGSRIYDWLH